jgi:DNA polymerase III subunit delta'
MTEEALPDLVPALLPWHEEAFSQLRNLQTTGRLGHAWLLAGHPGTGKLNFALYLAQYLLCTQSAEGKPCGACQDCHLFKRRNHPDFRLEQPEKALIKVDQIRDTIDFAQNMSRRGGMKVLVFEPA